MTYRNIGIRAALATPAALLAASAALLAACSPAGDGPAPTLALTPCRVANVENEVRCATLTVHEDRQSKQGREIGINVVVLPATARIKEPDPVFLFAGGPGQAASDLAREALAMLGGLNTRRDIVLVDQRGTGRSNGLNCKIGDAQSPDMIDVVKRETLSRKLLKECRDTLAARADLARYTTTVAMADIDDVRQALGYRQINLWGGSYGTRAAMEYLRRYPDAVRSVVLDGVAPPSLALPATFSRDAGAVYAKMLDTCAADARCNAAFPDLRARVDELLAAVDKRPRQVTLADPLSGNPREIGVNRESVLMAVFTSLYAPETVALLPAALDAARKGEFGPLMAMTLSFSDFADEKIYLGMRFSVMCAEDLPRARAVGEAAPFGGFFMKVFADACVDWPRGSVPADFSSPVVSAKPVLILSGGRDPVTPPAFGEEVRQSFANSLHLVAPEIGHGVSGRGCAPRLIKSFIEKASVAGLDGKCLERLPRPTYYQPMRLKDEKKQMDEKTNEAAK